MRWTGLLSLILLLATLSSPAAAEELGAYAVGGKSITNWHGQADVHSLQLERTKRRWANVELGLGASATVSWQPRSWFGGQYDNGNEPNYGIGASAVVRYLPRDGGWIQPYFDVVAGPMWSLRNIPAATSRLNFVTQPGLGLILAQGTRASALVGYRFMHISNGGRSSRNPGLNVSCVVVGMRFR